MVASHTSLMLHLKSIVGKNGEKYIRPMILRQIYRGFCQWRQLILSPRTQRRMKNTQKQNLVFELDLLHYLLERCYWLRYGDSDVVADLLKTLFRRDGHLGKVFNYQQMSMTQLDRFVDPELNYICLNSTWSEHELKKEKVKPIEYFIEHAQKRRLQFSGRRFEEQYIVQSIKCLNSHSYDVLLLPPCSIGFRLPEGMVLMLRHGLFATTEPGDSNVGRLLTGVLGALMICEGTAVHPELISYLEVGNCLLRTVKRVNAKALMKKQKIAGRRKERALKDLIERMSHEHLMPKLALRCSKSPQELKHLCRWCIRKALHNNWQLPKGIVFLPVPTRLQEYINLAWD